MKKFHFATIGTLLYIPVITIASELYPPLKDFLKNAFWHHWLGKSVVLIALYILLVLIFSATKETDEKKDEKYISWILIVTIIGAICIFGFFVLEYMKIL